MRTEDHLKLVLAERPNMLPTLARIAEVPASVLQEASERPEMLSPAHWMALEACFLGPPSELRERTLTLMRAGTAKALKDQRKTNLRRLLAERGSSKRLSELLGMAPPSISGLISSEDSAFGSNIARKIEVALNLPAGWLDQLDSAVPSTAVDLLRGNPVGVQAQTARAAGPASNATRGGAVVPPGLPGIHGLVEQRYRQLAMAGKVSERRAYELLGELMALDGAPDKQEEPSGRIPK